MVVLSIIYLLAFCFLISTCYVKKFKKYHFIAKLINSIGFLSIATFAYLKTGQNSYYFSMLPGFILCLLGDMFLAFEDDKGEKNFFVYGLSSFLVGHIVFVWAFAKRAPLRFSDFIIPIVCVVITVLLTKMKYMNVGKMKTCVLIYSFFISMLLSKGISLVLVNGATTSNVIILIGTLLFFISDAIIMFLYFYEKKHYIVKFFNLLTYYGGMYLLSLSLLY